MDEWDSLFPLQDVDERVLGSQDNKQSYFVDSSGNEYEPYALAWRYLGMYMDCDVDDFFYRQLNQNNNKNSDKCDRIILWAAYVDPKYKGGSIGEYQFYDWETGTWDESTCMTKRCARMDCHEPNSHFQLLGVYKETDGLTDWAEQLFKHEGYCVWQSDAYEFMQKYRETWPSSCYQLSLSDWNGNTVYLGPKPLGEGNITFGIYVDNTCGQESPSFSFSDYVIRHYYYYYYNKAKGEAQAAVWESTFDLWNTYMNTYKTCQPCRAYSLLRSELEDSNRQRRQERILGGNDGEGEDEQWGFNCYDAAGYTNCNQCYKFQTKTSMEEASLDDMIRASSQGSILEIKVYGRVFGKGGFRSSPLPETSIYLYVAGGLFLLMGSIVCLLMCYPIFVSIFQSGLNRIMIWNRKRISPAMLGEKFEIQSEDAQTEQIYIGTQIPQSTVTLELKELSTNASSSSPISGNENESAALSFGQNVASQLPILDSSSCHDDTPSTLNLVGLDVTPDEETLKVHSKECTFT